MARILESRVRSLEKRYAREIAQVAVDNFLDFVDYNWYRHAAYKQGDGRDFIWRAGLHRSGLAQIYKVADYLDQCAELDEFPEFDVIARTLLPRHLREPAQV